MDDTWTSELKQAGYELIETHISRVFLRGAHVYKRKRPVSLGFLDFSSLASRRQACEAEVALNRRLAPEVYLGVVGMVRSAEGELAFVASEQCGGREVLDWAVHMRRLRDQDRADVLLAEGHLGSQDVERLARQLTNFHREARADTETAQLGGYDALEQNVRENFAQLELLTTPLRADEQARLHAFQLRFLSAERERLERRAREGFVRDGHGDLRLEHCYRAADGSFVIIDCIEFNQRFRFADVCADLAFLTMDLRHHARSELAELLLAAYAHASGDYELYRLLDFYESYRATVRGKVSAILAQDAEVAPAARERGAQEARRYLLQAIAAGARSVETPEVFVSCGMIASGKSTLARALAERRGLAVLCADAIRKQLLGLAPEAPQPDEAFHGAYGEAMTARVYDTMMARAAEVLASGRSVVLDATFRARAHREQARALAKGHGARVTFLECRVPREVARARLAERAKGPHVSDGRLAIYDAFAASFEPVDELPADEHIVVDTTAPLAVALAQVP